MQITCPNCGEQIAAENINIQKMVAVCAHCDTVFSFDTPHAKLKRRKVKQPKQLTLTEGDTLQMAFRTNFRLDKSGDFLTSVFASGGFSFVGFMMLNEYMMGDESLLIPLAFFLLSTLLAYYWLVLTVYNKTHIEMDDEVITVSRQPLPNLLRQPIEVQLSGVVAIRCEETAISKKEGYDTPRFRVYAELEDGRQRQIVSDLTEEYAYFVTERLNERLHDIPEDVVEHDLAHLMDVDADLPDVAISDDGEIMPLSAKR